MRRNCNFLEIHLQPCCYCILRSTRARKGHQSSTIDRGELGSIYDPLWPSAHRWCLRRSQNGLRAGAGAGAAEDLSSCKGRTVRPPAIGDLVRHLLHAGRELIDAVGDLLLTSGDAGAMLMASPSILRRTAIEIERYGVELLLIGGRGGCRNQGGLAASP